jgi:ATP phosphoribosyltransferase regulatory subunit
MNELILKQEEKAMLALRSLYKSYGYTPYKMNKFEEYDFYLRNKDFLISDRVITFNDTDGRLLALKPDVTLSIVKNGKDCQGAKQKVYYNENVYRISGSTQCYREIMQTGLECIGDIDVYDLYESILLAAKSLSLISDCYVLEISHLGILSSLLKQSSASEAFRKEAANCIAEKNAHDLRRICKSYDVSAEETEKLCSFITIYGARDVVLKALEPLCTSAEAVNALETLRLLSDMLSKTSCSNNICFDFSIVNDMNYYNGIVFQGFLDGICESVLFGGQYDYLMERMGRSDGAVGFAIYLDMLEQLHDEQVKYDVDVVLLYDESVPYTLLAEKAQELVSAGKSVSAQKTLNGDLRFRTAIYQF